MPRSPLASVATGILEQLPELPRGADVGVEGRGDDGAASALIGLGHTPQTWLVFKVAEARAVQGPWGRK